MDSNGWVKLGGEEDRMKQPELKEKKKLLLPAERTACLTGCMATIAQPQVKRRLEYAEQRLKTEKHHREAEDGNTLSSMNGFGLPNDSYCEICIVTNLDCY